MKNIFKILLIVVALLLSFKAGEITKEIRYRKYMIENTDMGYYKSIIIEYEHTRVVYNNVAVLNKFLTNGFKVIYLVKENMILQLESKDYERITYFTDEYYSDKNEIVEEKI
jgi:hypothetical protein